MGRFVGKRPDRTAEVAERIADQLSSGERVLAAIHVSRPGTFGEDLDSAGGAALKASAFDLPPSFDGRDDSLYARWERQLTALGLRDAFGRVSKFVLVLSNQRLFIFRASKGLGRPKGLLAVWPLAEVSEVRVPRTAASATVKVGDAELDFELMLLSHKFLPDVYRKLPLLFEAARKKAA